CSRYDYYAMDYW
nr:immunoglobulin heavy chain junction region [Mus musculus]